MAFSKEVLKKGMKDGIPIGLGYFAVSFSLGVYASNVGVTALQGFIASLFTLASAGEYAGFREIGLKATYLEMFLVILVANCRYFLMSSVLSQRLDEKTNVINRLAMAIFVTDEIFGTSIRQTDRLKPEYTYGLAISSVLPWAIGTALGITVGNILPSIAVSALSVALYGMFLAIIIPPSRKSKIVLLSVLVSFAMSYIASVVPYLRSMNSGVKVFLLTVIISTAFALIFPIKDDDSKLDDTNNEVTL